MDIQLEKLELIRNILETNDVSIISKIKKFFKTEEKDFWEELTDEQKFEIEEGIKDAEAGRVVPYESFMEKYL